MKKGSGNGCLVRNRKGNRQDLHGALHGRQGGRPGKFTIRSKDYRWQPSTCNRCICSTFHREREDSFLHPGRDIYCAHRWEAAAARRPDTCSCRPGAGCDRHGTREIKHGACGGDFPRGTYERLARGQAGRCRRSHAGFGNRCSAGSSRILCRTEVYQGDQGSLP